MPAQTSQSKLKAKFGNRLDAFVKEHANDEPDYGFVRLPSGITNGVAQLTNLYLDEYKEGKNKGQLYLRGVGSVISPENVAVNGSLVSTKGMLTSMMRPLCAYGEGEKAVSLKQATADVMNELRILGGDTTTAETGADLEVIIAAILNEQPCFHFSTRESKAKLYAKGHPQAGEVQYEARTWEDWNGVRGLEDYVKPDNVTAATAGVNDTGLSSSDLATGSTASTTTAADYNDSGDVDSLVARAMADEVEAQDTLSAMAEAAGLKDAAAGAADWAAVGELLKGGSSGSTAESVPAKGDVFKYKLLDKDGKPEKDPKDKKKALKPIEVVVETVNTEKETVTVKNLQDGKLVKDPKDAKKTLSIPFAELIRE